MKLRISVASSALAERQCRSVLAGFARSRSVRWLPLRAPIDSGDVPWSRSDLPGFISLMSRSFEFWRRRVAYPLSNAPHERRVVLPSSGAVGFQVPDPRVDSYSLSDRSMR